LEAPNNKARVEWLRHLQRIRKHYYERDELMTEVRDGMLDTIAWNYVYRVSNAMPGHIIRIFSIKTTKRRKERT
jgi:hypothetical protein